MKEMKVVSSFTVQARCATRRGVRRLVAAVTQATCRAELETSRGACNSSFARQVAGGDGCDESQQSTASRHSHVVRAISIFLLLLLMAVPAWAATKVSAVLSSASIAVGESVDVEVNIQGDARADQPAAPTVEGLQFNGTSQSTQMSIIGANVTHRTTYTFRYIGRKEGKFSIPAIPVNVGGQQVNTEPLALTVTAGAQVKSAGDVAFAVIVPLKTTVFVGEDVGVEIRGYFDPSMGWSLQAKPELIADGFNLRGVTDGEETQQDVGGKRYSRVGFRTVVTPTKAGKLRLGEAKLRVLYSSNRPNPYDALGRRGRAQPMEIVAPALEIDVKPLPIDGRPKDFAGAIGQFTFEGTGSPAKVKIGEPITMNLVIKGQGNFARITVPPLAEADGWNAYDSEDNFTPTDQLQMSGVKTFKLPVSPLVGKTTIPVFAFTFFDPSAEKYVTLKNDATPLVVEGTPVGTPVGRVVAPPEAKPDLLPNLPAPGEIASLRPTLTPTLLFGAILAPLPILLGLLAWRSRKADPLAEALAALGRERSAVAAKLKIAGDRAELFEAVGRLLQIDTAVARRAPTVSFEDTAILSSRELDSKTDAAVRDLLAARSELLFAGGGRGETVSATERDRVLDAIAAWERCRPTRKRGASATTIHALLAFAFVIGAQAGEFENGSAAFAEGKFDDARRAYEHALADGWQAGVLFNLGNAYHRLEKPGRAALNYERVLVLAPTHPDAKANLKFVRDQSGGRVAEPTWYEAALSVVPPRATPWIAIGLACLGWLWAGAALWRRTGAAGVVGGTLLVLLGAGFGAAQMWQAERRADDAIVLEQSDARREPADRATLAEALAPGSRVRVISEQGEWTFAKLPGGQTGWLKAVVLERIVPPTRR